MDLFMRCYPPREHRILHVLCVSRIITYLYASSDSRIACDTCTLMFIEPS
ncbi:hypothetical protein M6B38_183100 [Iris pallida]|uniref:Uncharacterized protein n=1 Tax=Iris pallida TaxID=29817 RepID=A0AAX6EK27_IRIPA|nr:hypothetical protein M6B38_183100 [Iris pallida]